MLFIVCKSNIYVIFCECFLTKSSLVLNSGAQQPTNPDEYCTGNRLCLLSRPALRCLAKLNNQKYCCYI